MIRKLFLINIFFFIYSVAQANTNFNPEDIELGDILTKDELKLFEKYHRNLNFHNRTNQWDIYTDLYYWHGDHKGLNGKKIIEILRGTNQVVRKELWLGEIKIYDTDVCRRFTDYANIYFDNEYNILELVKENLVKYQLGKGWYFKIDEDKNIGYDFFKSEPVDGSKIIKEISCNEKTTFLKEYMVDPADKKNDYKIYLDSLENFPNISPFGFTLYSSLNESDILKEIDVGHVKVKAKKPSDFFNEYEIVYIPDDESKITRVVGFYQGEEFEDIYKEVKRLLTQKYEHQTYMDFGANLADLIEVSYSEYENTKWGIHLRVRKSDKSVRLFYYTKQWDADMKFREAVDKIKSENL